MVKLPSACRDSAISVTLKREKCAVTPDTPASIAVVIGSSTVLDEGVNMPRRIVINADLLVVSSGWSSLATTPPPDCVSDRQLATVVDYTRADQECDAGGGEEHHRREI